MSFCKASKWNMTFQAPCAITIANTTLIINSITIIYIITNIITIIITVIIFKINCKFPDDYFKKNLAGVEAEFEIELKNVQQITEAKVDKDLFEKLQMDVKDLPEFKEEIVKIVWIWNCAIIFIETFIFWDRIWIRN